MRSIVTAVCKELLGMFVADARLTMATLLLVAIVAGLVVAVQELLLAGGVLLVGCLAILIEAAHREATQQSRQ